MGDKGKILQLSFVATKNNIRTCGRQGASLYTLNHDCNDI